MVTSFVDLKCHFLYCVFCLTKLFRASHSDIHAAGGSHIQQTVIYIYISVVHRLATELSHCLPPIFVRIVVKDPGFHIQHQPVDVAGVFFLAMDR